MNVKFDETNEFKYELNQEAISSLIITNLLKYERERTAKEGKRVLTFYGIRVDDDHQMSLIFSYNETEKLPFKSVLNYVYYSLCKSNDLVSGAIGSLDSSENRIIVCGVLNRHIGEIGTANYLLKVMESLPDIYDDYLSIEKYLKGETK